MTSSDPNAVAVAENLDNWFRSILILADKSLFSIMPEGPHRNAVVLDVLKRNAKLLSQSELDGEGKLYNPLCFFLAAACRVLESTCAESAEVGLEIGSPAVQFKQELDEAINQSGIASGVSYQNKENRQVALALAINWGMRLLLAYALECLPSIKGSNRKDLAWVANLMGSLITATH